MSGIEDLAICAGDFNLHHLEWDDVIENDSSAEGLLQELSINGLSLLNAEYTPTWFHASGKTSVLDLFFCNTINLDLILLQVTIDPDARNTERMHKEKRYVPKNSNQEAKLVAVIGATIDQLSVSDDIDIDTIANRFRDTVEKAGIELSVLQKSNSSPSWWNEELSLLSRKQKVSKSKESAKGFRNATKKAKHKFFLNKMEEMSRKGEPWEAI
ncbi:hypothetical protein M378DRAFT_12159 [Amanita muscaria Koide BX008]|uniref:Endonuclease/exonuclease/phosphatase domain-containing protein n=1 Tax=Amanita muscaria (strain Koide BX008) TaxID=946122 RepID=A0A0C2X3W0_AMAMK|nr:hypothetical protein M378DRAFT_12159 [Amanita muscaria Koide BX008]